MPSPRILTAAPTLIAGREIKREAKVGLSKEAHPSRPRGATGRTTTERLRLWCSLQVARKESGKENVGKTSGASVAKGAMPATAARAAP